MITLKDIYLVIKLHPHDSGDIHSTVCGKFVLTDSMFHVLEDHCGWLGELESKPPHEIYKFIYHLRRSSYYRIVSLEEVRGGLYPDLLPSVEIEEHEPPITRFTYQHTTGQQQTLDFQGGKAFLDDFELSPEEVKVLLDNAHTGNATVFAKSESEEVFMSLYKIEPGLQDAFAALRQAVKSGAVHPDHLKTLQREVFTDSMVPGVGNKKAYADFLSRPKKGVYIHMDGNDFGQINKVHGFETGNKAISAFGNAMRQAMDETVGRSKGKLHRAGGDEFMAFVPSHEEAAHFASKLREKLEAIPAIGGTHNLSVSMGLGHTPDYAEHALIQAKGAKKKSGAAPGQAKTFAHSNVPGFEGPVPVSPDQLPLVAPPKAPEIAPTVAAPEASKPAPKPGVTA